MNKIKYIYIYIIIIQSGLLPNLVFLNTVMIDILEINRKF